ncbi:hypothetical protein HK096_004801, partial [Nowakowskiella sp. JEL0078]
MLIKPANEYASAPTWEKGSNAIFHYRAFTYIVNKHSHQECNDHTNRSEGLKETCGHEGENLSEHNHQDLDQKPVRIKVGDSRENSKPFELRIGMGFSVKSMEIAIKTMKVGEISRFLCSPEHAQAYFHLESVLRKERDEAKGIKQAVRVGGCCGHAMIAAVSTKEKNDLQTAIEEFSPVEYEFELLKVLAPNSFQKEVWEMSADEKWLEAPLKKEEAGALYKKGKFQEASEIYGRALVLLESLSMSTQVMDLQRDEQEKERKQEQMRNKLLFEKIRERSKKSESEVTMNENTDQEINRDENTNENVGNTNVQQSSEIQNFTLMELKILMNQTRLNYAACKLKLRDFPMVIIQCTEVLKHEPENIKALFRRGQAYLQIGRDLELAEKDFFDCMKILQSTHKTSEMLDLTREIAQLKAKQIQQQIKEKK